MSEDKDNGARSYKGAVLGDNYILHINVKFLLNALVIFGSLLYGFWALQDRITQLENSSQTANEKIAELVSRHVEEEEKKIQEMQEKLSFFEKMAETEVNINPLSWRKKKGNK